ncbi:hypothetical protein [Arthrobacter sp. IK3]|uniref:hypothetical protein n=1 Tax=Arthrobacter sp. IK3 TaxID=3448169 RepID=UPI003EDEE93F
MTAGAVPAYPCSASYHSTEDHPRGKTTIRAEITVLVPLRTASRDEAPVAAQIPEGHRLLPNWQSALVDIRVLDGVFYNLARTAEGYGIHPWNDKDGAQPGRHFGDYPNQASALQAIADGASSLLWIDGDLWARIPEPLAYTRYEGSGVHVSVGGDLGEDPGKEYSLTEVAEANRAARAEALAHGRTAPLDATVNVLIPEAFMPSLRSTRATHKEPA